MARRTLSVLVLSTLAIVGLVACGASKPQGEVAAPESSAVLAGVDAPMVAVSTSQGLFTQAPVVVLASVSDTTGTAWAAKLSASIGAPVLLTPAEVDGEGTAVADEIDRMEPETVLAVGQPAADWAKGAEVDAQVSTWTPSGDPATGDVSVDKLVDDDLIPATQPPDQLTGLTVLAVTGGIDTSAAQATARAAGADLVDTPAPDPRATSATVEAIAASPDDVFLGLGSQFGTTEAFSARIAVAATGVQLPGGGQIVFPYRRMVALYGHPGIPGLGVMGEQDVDDAVTRAEKVAAEYQPLVQEPVIPSFEIITTIAAADAGDDGNYSNETAIETLKPWVDAAGKAGMYVLLDLQPGRSDFLTQAKLYESLLKRPYVGLALDAEWRLGPDQLPNKQIGSVDAAEINTVVTWLADLTAANKLPQKVLMLHQFRLSMIHNRESVDTSRDELAVLIHADGFGTRGQKESTWDALVSAPAPPNIWWGWKNFYDEDSPTWTPAETYAVKPPTMFVSYQ